MPMLPMLLMVPPGGRGAEPTAKLLVNQPGDGGVRGDEGEKHMVTMCSCTKRVRKFSEANMMTSDWGRFKGPPSASEWTFGSAGRSNTEQNRS